MSYLDMARSILNGLPIVESVSRSACEKSEKSEKTLGAAVAWRVEAMRPQIPLRGAIPFLVARSGLSAAPGRCGSCGDALEEGQRYRCAPCQEAAWLALNEVREGAAASPPERSI